MAPRLLSPRGKGGGEAEPIRIRPPTFGRKLQVAGLLCGLGIFLLIQWVAYLASQGLVEASEAVAESQRVLLGLEEVVTGLQDGQRGQRGYVITGDERYLDIFHRAVERVPREIEDLRQLTAGDPLRQQQLRELEQLVAQALAEFQVIIDARKSHGFPAAQQLVLAGEGKKPMDALRRLVTQMQDQVRTSLDEKERAAKAAAARVPMVMLGGTAVSFSLLLTVFYLLNQEIARRRLAQEKIDSLNAELEERLRELAGTNKELEATNKELEAFTYSVSHDLRAPLRHVDGFSRILVEEFGPQLDPTARRYLERMQKGVRTMAQLVDDLLQLARIGRQEVRRQVTGLGPLVEEVLADLETESRRIEWRVAPLPFADCDPALMKQVFANLLSNAVKYTRPRSPAVIEVGALTQNGRPVLYVRDNGVGFSMKYADKLFGVFQRLHRTEDFEGTGVGLATVQRIVHKHGGEVWAEAELDKGATFYFTFGAEANPQTTPHTTSGGVPWQQPTAK